MLGYLAAVLAIAIAMALPVSSFAKPILSKPVTAEAATVPHGIGTCTLGADHIAAFILDDFILPPNDQYYTLLDPASCTQCTGEALRILAVNIVLSFRVACTQPVSISIVGAGDDPGCPTPNPADVILPAATHMLEGAVGLNTFNVPLDGELCIKKQVFLCVTFNEFGTNCSEVMTRPELVTTTANFCSPCIAWNYYQGGNYDFCVFAAGQVGPFVHFVDAECCGPLDVSREARSLFRLLPPKPNPSTREFTFGFELANPQRVAIDVLDLAGRTVRRLDSGHRFEAGSSYRVWDGRGDGGRLLPGGLYFIRLRVGDVVQLQKVALLP